MRTGDPHHFEASEAEVDQFEVLPIPTRDFAQAALNKAQGAYLKRWPEVRSDQLIWTLRKRPEIIQRTE